MKSKRDARKIRKARQRDKIIGTSARPRVAVFRSNTKIYVQAINDEKGHTVCSCSSKGDSIKDALTVGEKIADLLKKKKINTIVFDRGGHAYHGKVKAVAESMRKGGISF